MKNKKGISLIVLVITIIVLAILAATVIISIVNTGIINSSEEGVKNYDLTQVRDMANLAWSEALIEFSGKSGITDATYQSYVENYLASAGINIGDYNITASVSGITVTLKGSQNETEYAGLTITKDTAGFTFIPVDGSEVTDERLENLQAGDKVVYEDYVYAYRCEKVKKKGTATTNMTSWAEADVDGWAVSVIDESIGKTELSQMCGNIFGMPVVSAKMALVGWKYRRPNNNMVAMTKLKVAPQLPSTITDIFYAFYGCQTLTESPVIPAGVTNMEGTFYNCFKLKETPVIPLGVENMAYTFYGCSALTKAPAIPVGVTNMEATFMRCSGLTNAPVIPLGVENMAYTFYGCSALTKAPAIPVGVTNMGGTFYSCTKITESPSIPVGVTNMDATFSGCTSLIEAPAIPESVTNMYKTFYNCTSLVEGPVILANVTVMQHTFYGCTALTKAPLVPVGVESLWGAFSKCTSLVEAPVIPTTVTNMYETFSDCTSLQGIVQVNSSNITTFDGCFNNITNNLTVRVPQDSTTYNNCDYSYGTSSNITIETFVPQVTE